MNFGGGNFLSEKTLYKFDCENEKIAIVSLIQYSGIMGAGDVVNSSNFNDNQLSWANIAPKSVGQKIFKAACSKK